MVQNQVPADLKSRYSQLIRGFNQLQEGVTNRNRGQIKNAFECTPTLSQMVLTQAIQGNIDVELKQKASIGEYIKDIKAGVCRHFSLIAKMLYSRLKDRITNKTESELIYVGQLGKKGGHAYNLLMWTEK